MPPVFVVYLFGLFCLTAAQYDDLSVLEEVLERSTPPAVMTTEPEVTVETSTAVIEATTPDALTTSTDSEVPATASTTERVNVTSEEKSAEESTTESAMELLPITSTAMPENIQSTTTESQSTTQEISTTPDEEATSTKQPPLKETTEIPHIDKEPITGLGKPDLSRIYRKLFPYRRV
ncbi:hypothetical protein Aduo_004801 [Ancylostoma duodenale]